jgi:hypothetical protein
MAEEQTPRKNQVPDPDVDDVKHPAPGPAPAPAPASSTTVERSSGFSGGFWTVLALAISIATLVGLTGKWSGGFWVALLAYLVLGAIFPPAGFMIGGPVLLYLALVHGQQALAVLQGLVSPKPAPQTPGGIHP